MASPLPVHIRPETPADIAIIHEVESQAFGRNGEADLVDALRAAGRLTLSLVAVNGDGDVVGHVAFSPVTVTYPDGEPRVDLGMGPVAVAPGVQKRGVGSSLVRAGLEAARAAGHAAVFVLGAPAYYGRFGFRPAAESELRWEVADLAEFQLLVLDPARAPLSGGVVAYAPEFVAV